MIPKLTEQQKNDVRKHLEHIEWEIGYHEKKIDTLVAEKAVLDAILSTQEDDKQE